MTRRLFWIAAWFAAGLLLALGLRAAGRDGPAPAPEPPRTSPPEGTHAH